MHTQCFLPLLTIGCRRYPKKKLCNAIYPCPGVVPPATTCPCPRGFTPFEVQVLSCVLIATITISPSLCLQANHVFDGIRCRVEKIIAKVAVLGLFHNGKCRLHYPALLATVKLSLHTAALWSRMHPQYDGHGDWAHF